MPRENDENSHRMPDAILIIRKERDHRLKDNGPESKQEQSNRDGHERHAIKSTWPATDER